MEQVAKPTGLFARKRKWYFRMRVPKDLVHVLGTEWVCSLQTGDYQTALRRHSEEAAKFHLTLVTERAKLAGTAVAPQADKAAQQAYEIAKRYYEQRIAAIASTGTTRLEMLLGDSLNPYDRPDIDVLAELDGNLVDILDPDNENGQMRTHQLVEALAKENGLPIDHKSAFMRTLAEQVRRVLIELASEDRAHFLGETSTSSFKRFSNQTPPESRPRTFGELASSFFNDVLKVQPGRPRTIKKHEATLNFLVRHLERRRRLKLLAAKMPLNIAISWPKRQRMRSSSTVEKCRYANWLKSAATRGTVS